ncbi:unknown [Crocosphaera subtropica ATCC 51142]|uniref:Uncharacterized protein n=1 Tax=Crocosphaera subtropica (strain ATCC 51142 / BH68) TaxID=43989 RepID=B1WSJ4_CROS5|nr:hypothetical protein [Crocosphaera subtropica]ACB53573.1 unknown [Crocosphaera subtropica ATCC 51142]
MNTHKIETTLTENGKLLIDNIPFKKGESVEVIIIKQSAKSCDFNQYPLAGKVIKYDKPLEPATNIEDWESLK